MAKSSSIQKNLNRFNMIKKFKKQRDTLKSKIMDKSISIEDRLKFQSVPLKAIKNQILFKYKSFNFNFISTTKSERHFAFINVLNQIVYSKMKPVTVYDIQLSKSFSYKFINLIISGIQEPSS